MSLDKFVETLVKEATTYSTEKSNPNNQIRINANLVIDLTKTAEAQIAEIKESYK